MPTPISWVVSNPAASVESATNAITGGEEVARNFLLDEDGDLAVANGTLLLSRGVAAVRQAIMCRIRMFLAEWFLDLDEGTDWFGLFFVKSPSQAAMRAELRRRIVETPGVNELLEFNLRLVGASRQQFVTFRADTDLGELVVNEEEV